MALRRFLIGLTLLAMPLLLGGARPWIWSLIAAGFFFGVVILSWRPATTGLMAGISKFWIMVLVLLLAYPLLQVAPLPRSWLAVLSPQRLLWIEKAEQATGLPAALSSISYTPLETVFEGFIWWLFLLVFALVFRQMLEQEKRLDWLFHLLFILAAVEAFYGLLQVLIPAIGVLGVDKGQGLARGTFINRNHYACFLGMLWPLLLAVVWGMGGERRELTYPERQRLSQVWQKQVFFGFVIGLMILGIFFSQSRGGIIGSVVSLTVLIAVSRKMRTRGMLFLVLGSWLVMLVYGGIIGFDNILRRFDQMELGAEGRFQIWRTAVAIIKDHSLAGTGVGSFGDLFRVYQDFLDDTMTSSFAHNDYLHLTVELGIPMAALVVVLVWGYWWGAAWGLVRGEGREAGGARAEGTEQRVGRAEAEKVRRAEAGRTSRRSLHGEQRRLLAVGALAGAAAFLCHAWVEFNWHIPANALYFVLLLVLIKGEKVGIP